MEFNNIPPSPLSKRIRYKLKKPHYSGQDSLKDTDVHDSAYVSYNPPPGEFDTSIISSSPMFDKPSLEFNKQYSHSPLYPQYFDHPIYQLTSDIETPISNASPINPKCESDFDTSLLLSKAKNCMFENSLSDNLSFSEKEEVLMSPPRISFTRLNLYDKPNTPLKANRNLKRKFFTSIEKLKKEKSLHSNLHSTPYIRPKFDVSEKSISNNPLSKDLLLKQVSWMRESQAVRYFEEFIEVECLGSGHFGNVFKCMNRLDGCYYAIKKSKAPFIKYFNEYAAIKEVCAHAILGNHPHIVRYYSAWAEDRTVFIQNEYCNGGTLADLFKQNMAQNTYMSEEELKTIILHIGRGLQYFHALKLVHLDIKPSNIFITKVSHAAAALCNHSDEGFESSDDEKLENIVYKIGDLGLVTSIADPEFEEGDCRYLPPEILQENYTDITKADIFSLGLTIYEIGANKPLPPNGPEWQKLRNGEIYQITRYSNDFTDILKIMMHSSASQRPSAYDLISNPCLHTMLNRSKAQLRKELNNERFKNQILTKKLEETESENMLYKRLCQNLETFDRKAAILMYSTIFQPQITNNVQNLPPEQHIQSSKPILIGHGVKRSVSVKDF